MKTLLLLFTSLALPAADTAKDQVSAAMESFRQAMLHRDRAALNRLTSDDLAYTHSAGKVESKAEFVEAIASGKSIATKLEFTSPTIRIYGDTALYHSRVDLWHSATDVVPMDVLHVWVKSPGGWRMVARQATRLAK